MKISLFTRIAVLSCTAGLLVGAARNASADMYGINWMEMSFATYTSGYTPILPNDSTFYLSGVGNVLVHYTPSASTGGGGFSATRYGRPDLISGSVSSGGDTYAWNNFETFSRVHLTGPSVGLEPWSVTYTFDHAVTSGTLALGVDGLGRTDLTYGSSYISFAHVAQNGTYLGEYGSAPDLGPNQFASTAHAFSLENALPGDLTPGSPAFNTRLAVVRVVDDAITSLTVNVQAVGSDGIGVNIGYIQPVPEPGALAASGVLLSFIAGYVIRRRKGQATS